MKINFLGERKVMGEIDFWALVSVFSMGGFLLYSLFFGQSVAVYALALVVCGLAVLICPKAGMISVFVLCAWFERNFTLQPLYFGENVYKLYPVDLMIFFLVVAVAYQLFVGKIKWQWQKMDKIILVFGIVVLFGYAASFFGLGDTGLAFSSLKNYFLYAIVYVLVSLLLVSKADWKKTMQWLMIGGLGLFFFLAYGLISGHGLWSEYTPLSTYGQRLLAGTHVFYLMLFGFGLFANYLSAVKKESNKGFGWYELVLGLVVLGSIVSLVRHLWVAGLVLGIVWLIVFASEKRVVLLRLVSKLFIVVVVLGLIYVWIFGLVQGQIPLGLQKVGYALSERMNVDKVLNLEDDSFSWRLATWKVGLSMWMSNPVFGTGLGQTLYGWHRSFAFAIPARDMHNDYLGILLQLGLVGIGIVAWWWVEIIRSLRLLWKKFGSHDGFYFQMLFTWGNAVLLFMIVFSISVYWDINLFIIWWWFALAAIRWLEKQTDYENITD